MCIMLRVHLLPEYVARPLLFSGYETGSFVSRLFDKIHSDKDKVVNGSKIKKSAKAEAVKSAGIAVGPRRRMWSASAARPLT